MMFYEILGTSGDILWMSLGFFGDVLGTFWRCFGDVLRTFQGHFGDVLGKFCGCFKDDLAMSWGCFGDVFGILVYFVKFLEGFGSFWMSFFFNNFETFYYVSGCLWVF